MFTNAHQQPTFSSSIRTSHAHFLLFTAKMWVYPTYAFWEIWNSRCVQSMWTVYLGDWFYADINVRYLFYLKKKTCIDLLFVPYPGDQSTFPKFSPLLRLRDKARSKPQLPRASWFGWNLFLRHKFYIGCRSCLMQS